MDILNARYVPPGPLDYLPPGFALTPCTNARYWEMLEVLPPIAWVSVGFLVGEPADHRLCLVTGAVRPTYAPFVDARRPGGQHYEGTHDLTGPEWRRLAINPEHLAEAIRRGATA